MSAAGGLTVLVCDNDHTASKAYACQPDGSWKKTADYHAGFTFGTMARECPDLQALAALIEDIRTDGNAFIVRGELDDAGRGACEEADARNRVYKIARRKNDKGDGIPAHLTEVPRQWIMLDIDGWPLPPSITTPARASWAQRRSRRATESHVAADLALFNASTMPSGIGLPEVWSEEAGKDLSG